MRFIAAVAALAVLAPSAAHAKPKGTYSLIVEGEGDQTDPSIDRQYVVFASDAGGDWDVLLYRIGALPEEPLQPIAGGPDRQDQPDVHQTFVAYRGPDGIYIRDWDRGRTIRGPGALPAGVVPACSPEDAAAEPVIGETIVAWQCGAPGFRDIAVARHRGAYEEYKLVRPGGTGPDGDQHSPAAFGSLVAFIDGGDGHSVWLHDGDSAEGATTLVCDGRATGVAVGQLDGDMVLAVTRASQGHDEDVEIWDASGLVTTLRVDGEQRNPHLSEDWVAFEDLSTGRSQVILWQWTSGIVFVPNPSTSNQTLNDVSTIPNVEVRVVFADDRDGTRTSRDIALYRLTFVDGAIPDDGTGSGWPWGPPPPPPPPAERPAPASCGDFDPDDLDPIAIATLDLGREKGKPLAGDVKFSALPFQDDATLPVLVCITATRVSSGWVALDDEAIARPSDFSPSVTRLAIPAVAEEGEARIAGVIAGTPGASLFAWVLPDPGRVQPIADSGTALPAAALRTGCGNPGSAGSLAMIASLAAALRLLRRRRDREG